MTKILTRIILSSLAWVPLNAYLYFTGAKWLQTVSDLSWLLGWVILLLALSFSGIGIAFTFTFARSNRKIMQLNTLSIFLLIGLIISLLIAKPLYIIIGEVIANNREVPFF